MGIMFEVVVEKQFSAARHLLGVDGPCANVHGHNFIVKVWVHGQQLDEANILCDYKVLKAELMTILTPMDHQDLNTLPMFANQSPTTEFLARYIYTAIKAKFTDVIKVAVFDTPKSGVFYYELPSATGLTAHE
jgi:6-pyruvoyltetrahydropterin/6-carboxytetrahydropterin synthase